MAKNTTHLADINELAVGYFLNGQQWWSPDVQRLFKKKAGLFPCRDDVTIQVERGRVMAAEVSLYLKRKARSVQGVWWTARPGTLQAVVPEASVNNPTDVLVRVNSGDYLGVSCKSSHAGGEVPLKNPGIGSVCRVLDVDYQTVVTEAVNGIVVEFKLPGTHDARKAAIRARPDVQKVSQARGSEVLRVIRDRMLDKLTTLDPDALRTFVVTSLIDADANTVPRYVRVTGTGNLQDGFKATLADPFEELLTGTFTVEAHGSESIGFRHEYGRVCLLRPKFESEKLASTLKCSVDPW